MMIWCDNWKHITTKYNCFIFSTHVTFWQYPRDIRSCVFQASDVFRDVVFSIYNTRRRNKSFRKPSSSLPDFSTMPRRRTMSSCRPAQNIGSRARCWRTARLRCPSDGNWPPRTPCRTCCTLSRRPVLSCWTTRAAWKDLRGKHQINKTFGTRHVRASPSRTALYPSLCWPSTFSGCSAAWTLSRTNTIRGPHLYLRNASKRISLSNTTRPVKHR